LTILFNIQMTSMI